MILQVLALAMLVPGVWGFGVQMFVTETCSLTQGWTLIAANDRQCFNIGINGEYYQSMTVSLTCEDFYVTEIKIERSTGVCSSTGSVDISTYTNIGKCMKFVEQGPSNFNAFSLTPILPANCQIRDDDPFGTNGGEIDQETIEDCFPAVASVERADGSFVSMAQLEIGDVVRVSETEFSPVVFWGHRSDQVSTNYVRVELSSGRTTMLSKNHLAYVNGELVAAGKIRVGDLMRDAELGEESSVQTVEHNVAAKGLYNPHTAHGDLVVDGVVVSTYGVVDARVAHALIFVERLMRRLGMSALGNMLEQQTPWIFQRVLSISA